MEFGKLSRRRFLEGTGASLAAFAPFEALAQNECPSPKYCKTNTCASPKIPDFAKLGKKPEMIAGYRPHRDDTYRLEREHIADKWIIHNYGHSGAGITMSLGCAEQVVLKVQRIIDQQGKDVAKSGIAVLGGGVMGLTAARALVKRYFPTIKIDVYTDQTYKTTTSNKAGGQWAPSTVEWDEGDPDERERFKKILTDAKTQFIALGSAYGVSARTNFTLFAEPSSGLETAHRLGLICRDEVNPLPFANMKAKGYAYGTLLVEPPIFLKKIHNELLARITMDRFHVPYTFADRKGDEPMSQDIAKLSQKIIVNCTGLGAGRLFNDPKLKPHKGQLVLLDPQNLDYLFSGYKCGNGWAQYLFPRSDHLVLGGTYQGASTNEDPHSKVGIHIAASLRELFENGKQECADKSPDQLDAEPVA